MFLGEQKLHCVDMGMSEEITASAHNARHNMCLSRAREQPDKGWGNHARILQYITKITTAPHELT